MRKLLTLLFLSICTIAVAQNSRVDGVISSRYNNPAAGAYVAACAQPATITTTAPYCSPLAPLCASLTDVNCNTGSFPVQANGLGNYFFYINQGAAPYTYCFYGSALAVPTLANGGCLPDQYPPGVGGSGNFSAGGDLVGSPTSQTVKGLDTVKFCTGFTPTNGQYLQLTTALSPNPCYTAVQSVQVNSAATAPANLNNTTPAAPTNGVNVNFQVVGPNVSAYLPGTGSPSNCLSGAGTYVPCSGGSGTPSGNTGQPLSNVAGSTTYATSLLYLDVSQTGFHSGSAGTCTPGTNDNICIANAIAAVPGTPGSGGGYAIIDDSAVTGNQVWTASPWAGILSNGTTNITSPVTCGKFRINAGTKITTSTPIAVPRCWDVEVISAFGQNATITASSTWPGIYTAGTVTTGAPSTISSGQYQFTVTCSSGCSFVGNVFVGEEFGVCQGTTYPGANGPACGGNGTTTCATACGSNAPVGGQAQLTYGMVIAVTDNTHLIVATANANSGAANSSAVNYVIKAPLIWLGAMGADGGDSGGASATWTGGTISCNNEPGCTAFTNFSQQENSGVTHVVINNVIDTYLDIEGINAVNSGPYDRMVMNASSSCTSATRAIITRIPGSLHPIENTTVNFDGCTSGAGEVAVDFEEGGDFGPGIHFEGNNTSTNIFVDVGENTGGVPMTACPVYCPQPVNVAAGAHLHDFAVTGTGQTAINIGSNAATQIETENITASWTNVIVDNARGCSITSATGDSTISRYDHLYNNGWFGTAQNAANSCGSGGTYVGTIKAGIFNATTGFQVGGAAPSGHTLCGNGTYYVDGTCGGGLAGLTVDNNGSSQGTATGTPILNFVSGCTSSALSGSTFSITCPVGGGTGTQYQTAYFNPANTAVGGGPGIIGQTWVSDGTAGPPLMLSPGMSDSATSPVSLASASYTIECDSGTTMQDRTKAIRFTTGGNPVIIPLSTGSGCSNLVFTGFNLTGSSLTLNATSTDTFTVSGGLGTQGASQTTASIPNNAWFTANQGASGIWEVRINTPLTGMTCGSLCYINPTFDKTATGLLNPTADATFTLPNTSVTGITLTQAAPASSAGTGATAGYVFVVQGGTGGATSSTGTATGGAGSSPQIIGGTGGAATGAGTTATVGGRGGAAIIEGGPGGAGQAGNDSGGNGGAVILQPGVGGTASGSGTAGTIGAIEVEGVINPCYDTSGSGTAQSCTLAGTFAPVNNLCMLYSTTTANSGTGLTINVDSSSAVSVAVPGSSGYTTTLTTSPHSIPANTPIPMCYNSTASQWQVVGNGAVNGSITIAGTTVSLGGSTSSFPSPGAIGGTTPAAITGTTITANTSITCTAATCLGSATATTQTAGDNSTKVATTAYTNTVYNLVQTSGSPYTLLGLTGYYWNDASGAYTFQLDSPVAGKQYCFGNYSGQTGVITVKSTTSVYIVYKGANGTVTTGTLVSGGAAGDFVCMEGVDTTHYMVTGVGYGTWTNN